MASLLEQKAESSLSSESCFLSVGKAYLKMLKSHRYPLLREENAIKNFRKHTIFSGEISELTKAQIEIHNKKIEIIRRKELEDIGKLVAELALLNQSHEEAQRRINALSQNDRMRLISYAMTKLTSGDSFEKASDPFTSFENIYARDLSIARSDTFAAYRFDNAQRRLDNLNWSTVNLAIEISYRLKHAHQFESGSTNSINNTASIEAIKTMEKQTKYSTEDNAAFAWSILVAAAGIALIASCWPAPVLVIFGGMLLCAGAFVGYLVYSHHNKGIKDTKVIIDGANEAFKRSTLFGTDKQNNESTTFSDLSSSSSFKPI